MGQIPIPNWETQLEVILIKLNVQMYYDPNITIEQVNTKAKVCQYMVNIVNDMQAINVYTQSLDKRLKKIETKVELYASRTILVSLEETRGKLQKFASKAIQIKSQYDKIMIKFNKVQVVSKILEEIFEIVPFDN